VYTGLQLLITIDTSSTSANADIGFVKAGEKLRPSDVEAQLGFQQAVQHLHSAVQPIVDREDDTIIRQQRASLGRPAVELGVSDQAPLSAGAFMANDDDLSTEEIPSWALNHERERLSKKASQLSESEFVEILKRSGAGNPYAEGLLNGIRKESQK
jgi:hypothetical protein